MGVIDGHDVRALRRALRAAFEAERPVVVHCATVKGKGFSPAEDGGLEGMEKWHAAKPNSIAKRMPAPSKPAAKPAAPQYTQVFGEALVAECERDSPRRRHHRGDELRHGAQPAPEGDAGALLRRRHRRAAGAALRGRPGAPGRAARGGDLLHLPPARVRPDRPRPLPPAAPGRARDGPRRARRRRRPDAPRRLRHRLPALPAEHHADGAARRGDARAHAPHRAAPRRRAGRPALPARRGRRGAAARRSPSCWRSAPARSCARASASRSSATAPASARRSAPPTCSPRAGST